MTEPRRLAAYVQPSLTEARLQAQWTRIAEQPAPGSWRRVYWYSGGLAATVAVMVVLFVFGTRTPEHHTTPLTVERMASGVQRVTFPEELSVTLQSAASYRILERTKQVVHLELERGAAEFDVTPGRARRVVVTAAGFDVEVVGTRFEVVLREAPGKPDVEVRVSHGNVKVRSAGDQHTVLRELAAGESWATHTNAVPSPADSEGESSASVSASAASAASLPATAPSATPRPPSAKDLFEAAESSRLKGNVREAAALLDRLRRGFPGDPRAGLAAFELGRLRMDQFGDPAGALNALADALRLDPSARFREDAEARTVQLLHRLGQLDRCRTARTEYLRRYPAGSHVAAVKGQCAP